MSKTRADQLTAKISGNPPTAKCRASGRPEHNKAQGIARSTVNPNVFRSINQPEYYMTTDITIFETSTSLVNFTTKKGAELSLTPEGALYKGGVALASLKSTAMLSAHAKACNGKYRAAAEIIGAVFPKIMKVCTSFFGPGAPVYFNKINMTIFLNRVASETEPVLKGWTDKQASMMLFVHQLQEAICPVVVTIDADETVDA